MARPPRPKVRGNYADAADDYTLCIDNVALGEVDGKVWATLVAERRAMLAPIASSTFNASTEAFLEWSVALPKFAEVDAWLKRKTEWSIVAVPGVIPTDCMYRHLSERRLPLVNWMRGPSEIDYCDEPDLFHDLFGHLPMLLDADFRLLLQTFGEVGCCLRDEERRHILHNIYFSTVEFGLIRETGGVKLFGAGLLSSAAEASFCLSEGRTRWQEFSYVEVMKADPQFDTFQHRYFVFNNYGEISRAIDLVR